MSENRTYAAAAEMRCPFGIAVLCQTKGCMAWREGRVITDTRKAATQPGEGWLFDANYMRPKDDPAWLWYKCETGGDCRRLLGSGGR